VDGRDNVGGAPEGYPSEAWQWENGGNAINMEGGSVLGGRDLNMRRFLEEAGREPDRLKKKVG